MTKEQIEKVEAQVKSTIGLDKFNILMLSTIRNNNLTNHKGPSYVTVIHLQDKKTGLEMHKQLNSLKVLRALEKEEKYKDVK